MRWFFVTMLCGGVGLWVGAQYQIPQWIMWLLLSLGTALWVFAKWHESQEAEQERNHDRA